MKKKILSLFLLAICTHIGISQKNNFNSNQHYSTLANKYQLRKEKIKTKIDSLKNITSINSTTPNVIISGGANISKRSQSSPKTYIPDSIFENFLEINGVGDGIANNDSVFTSSIGLVTGMTLPLYVADLTGLQDFSLLSTFTCNYSLTPIIDISSNSSITTFNFQFNSNLEKVIVNNSILSALYFNSNSGLKNLEITAPNLLTISGIGNSRLNYLNLNSCGQLLNLTLPLNNILDIEIDSCLGLTDLDLEDNSLNYIDLTNNYNLEYVYLSGNYSLYGINGLNNNLNLEELWCYDNNLSALDLSNCTSLTDLECEFNRLNTLNLTNTPNLEFLYCNYNDLDSLNLIDCPALEYLYCGNNNLENISLAQNPNLKTLDCSKNYIGSLDLSNNQDLTSLNCGYNHLSSLDLRNNNNTSFSSINTFKNPSLYCISVDDTIYSNNNWNSSSFIFDSTFNFYTNCNSFHNNICDTNITIYDTLTTQVFDSISIYDTLITQVFDSISIYDTLTVIDTLTLTIYDTNYISISVTDTLYMDVSFTSSSGLETNTLLVYPNPASDIVIINNGNYANMSNYTLEIVNSLGQQVFNSNINTQLFQIPITDLGSTGLYFINIVDNNNNIVVTKHLILN